MQEKTIQDYCRLIDKLDNGDGVNSKDIAKTFNLSKNTVALTLQRLANIGFVKMKRYGKAKLTKKGLKLAKKMNFKHRVLETFLFTKLKINKKNIHSQACALEHWINDIAIKRLYIFLGRPKYDPHGKAILSKF